MLPVVEGIVLTIAYYWIVSEKGLCENTSNVVTCAPKMNPGRTIYEIDCMVTARRIFNQGIICKVPRDAFP